jgi:predicted aspartyl protease
VNETTLGDLARNGVSLDFALKYLKGVAVEFGTHLTIWHEPPAGEMPPPHRTFSTTRDGERHQILPDVKVTRPAPVSASARGENTLDPRQALRFDAFVDTGAGWLTLPAAWRDRLGNLPTIRTERLETANQRVIPGEVCGPVTIQIDGFRPIVSEVIFMQMEARDGRYDPLLGYLALEQSSAAVDMVRHRLVAVRYVDAKVLRAA